MTSRDGQARDRLGGGPCYPPDYTSARERFVAAARQSGYTLERHPLSARGPAGEALGIDVARRGDPAAEGVLILSGALHGIEGFFGSAVLTAWLEGATAAPPLDGPHVPPVSPLAASRRTPSLINKGAPSASPVCDAASGSPGNPLPDHHPLPTPAGPAPPRRPALVLIHALNPWGFAHLRRTDEHNIDLNRNFLPPGLRHEGGAPLYRTLDPALNPARPPSRFDPFPLHALAALARHGRTAVAQAIAGGQHDFPRGLFYGGREEGEVARVLREQLPRWAGRASRVLHLDLHTGLGPRATYRLLADLPLKPDEHWLREGFGDRVVEPAEVPATYYRTRGSLGTWGRILFEDRRYTLLVAEFGTYGPLQVLRALRRENQVHHFCRPEDPRTLRAKRRLREVFCPESPAWRRACLAQGVALIRKAVEEVVR